MRNGWAITAVAMLLIGSGTTVGEAQTPVDASTETAACLSAAYAPPCGWINPYLELDLEDNRPCRDREAGSDCMAPPVDGDPYVWEGEFILSWDISEEGTYAADPDDPIVVTFASTSSSPSFIGFSIEPSTFTLDSTTINNPQYVVQRENPDGSSSFWYEYKQPVTVTFARDGDPTLEDIERISINQGLVKYLVRIHSDSSGSTYKDSYGLELVTFHAGAAEGDAPVQQVWSEVSGESLRSTPSLAVPVSALGLLGAAMAARRRS